MAHAHLHVPHELGESGEHAEAPKAAPARGERMLELAAVLLLSLTTLATAWSGYQAALWSGEQSQDYAQASTNRVKGQQEFTRAGQLRIDDLTLFDNWLDARAAGKTELARIYRRRFRPEFNPAFRAWLAQRPLTNPRAVPGPLYMPQYRPVALARAKAFDAKADALYNEGTDA